MTGYYLELGYNAALGGEQQIKAWDTLVAVFTNVIGDPERVVREVQRVEAGAASEEAIRECAVWYTHPERTPDVDCTFRIHDKEDFIAPMTDNLEPAPFKPYIAQLASGGGPGRATKMAVRRAICRLVIEDMHRLKIEVNLRVS